MRTIIYFIWLQNDYIGQTITSGCTSNVLFEPPFIFRNNVHPRIWPRASAAAERLWSFNKQDNNVAAQRLEEQACRMNRRGIPAQPPNGAGFCIT